MASCIAVPGGSEARRGVGGEAAADTTSCGRFARGHCPSFVSTVIVPPTGPSPHAVGFKRDERQRTGNARHSPPGSAAVTAHTRITRNPFVARSSGLPLPGGRRQNTAQQVLRCRPPIRRTSAARLSCERG